MKKHIFLVIGLALLFLPALCGAEAGVQMLCIFVGSIWLWITSSIELGSVACLAALCLLPEVKPATVFSGSFGNATILFLIFSFVLTYALSATGVLRRVAIYFIDNRFAKKSARHFVGAYFLSMLVIGSFMAPTTVFILFFSIVQEIFALLGLEKGDPLARSMMVGTGFFASISCAMTPIAHTFPLMALGYYETATGTAISYIEYLKYGLPIGLILSVAAYLLLASRIRGSYDFSGVHFENTKWTGKEIFSVIVFLCVVACWLATGIAPDALARLNALGTAWPAMVGCIVLAAFGCLSIRDGFTKGVAWSAILLCSATLALGSFLTKDEYGIMPAVSEFMAPRLENFPILLLVIVFAVVMTNLISNIVTTTVSFNLFVPVLLAAPLLASPAAATIAIGICASLAYALPSSIAHIALAGSSGWATSRDMLGYGAVMIVVSIAVAGLIFTVL